MYNSNNKILIFPFQISPPSESIVVTNPWHPWWQRYQPIGYNLCSRSGNENELRDMITRCNNVGVNAAIIDKQSTASLLLYYPHGKFTSVWFCRCTSTLMQSSTTCVERVVDLVPTQAVDHISMPTARTSPQFHTHTWTSMMANATPAVETLRTTRISIKYEMIWCLSAYFNLWFVVHCGLLSSWCYISERCDDCRWETVVWLVFWTWLWRRTMCVVRRPTTWTSWLTWEWLDSEWTPASTCGLVIFLLSMAVLIIWTLSGFPLAQDLLSSKRYFHSFLKGTSVYRWQNNI